MSQNNPLVTVITPTYNRADTYLAETIESVLAQDYPNFEYIVLDDGSQDDTVELLESYDDPRLQWSSHANMGESRTVNKGLEMAQGEFILIVNSDDPILPDLITKSVEFLQENPDVWATYPDWVMIDNASNIIEEITVLEYAYENMLRYHHCPLGPGAVFRRAVVDVGIRREGKWRYVGDYEFWLKVGLRGKLKRLPQTLASWRSHSEGATIAYANPDMAQEHVDVVKEYFQKPNLSITVQKVKHEALCNAYYIAGTICLPKYYHTARVYFGRSILAMPFAPTRYPNFKRQWRVILRTILFPKFAYTIVSKIKETMR